MKIGFTGTQRGMTEAQQMSLRDLLLYYTIGPKRVEFHHGDCNGADAEAHDIAAGLGFWVIVHAPTDDAKRAFKSGPNVTILKPWPYLMRNKNIVNATDLLIAAPGEVDEVVRSGTWSTIRYARRRKKKMSVIFPDGLLVRE